MRLRPASVAPVMPNENRSLAPAFNFVDTKTLLATLHNTDVVLGQPGLLCPLATNPLPRLKWLQSTWAGVEGLLAEVNSCFY